LPRLFLVFEGEDVFVLGVVVVDVALVVAVTVLSAAGAVGG
jgi:hypothetical protein